MLKTLTNIINVNQQALEEWYQSKLIKFNPCFYSSVDVRYSGKQLVPVDCNLFPAGFNNLNLANIDRAANLSKNYFQEYFPQVKKILIIGENHTRNLNYLDNLAVLKQIIIQAGYQCEIGSLTEIEDVQYQGTMHRNIDIIALTKHNKQLSGLDGFIPDLILLNNDLMTGIPEKLEGLSQIIIPHPNNGWFKRRKSHHFSIYNKLVEELGQLFAFPVALLTAEYDICNGIDFKTKQGVDILATKVDQLLGVIREKYQRNKIDDQPYVIIKSNYGTYGMGIMTAKSAEEIYNLNQKSRRQMQVTKNNVVNEQVIIQEGIKTIDVVNGNSAEPLLCLVNHQLSAFLYRSHPEKDQYSNLNSVGMQISNRPQDFSDYYQCCSFVARLATLAATLENGSGF